MTCFYTLLALILSCGTVFANSQTQQKPSSKATVPDPEDDEEDDETDDDVIIMEEDVDREEG